MPDYAMTHFQGTRGDWITTTDGPGVIAVSGMKPIRCIVGESMPKGMWSMTDLVWPDDDAAKIEAAANMRAIAAVPDLLWAVPDPTVLEAVIDWFDRYVLDRNIDDVPDLKGIRKTLAFWVWKSRDARWKAVGVRDA